MQDVSLDEYKGFLLEGARYRQACHGSKGRPVACSARIWFDLDGDEVVFTTWHESVKVANIRHDPRVSLCVDEKTPPFAFALIEGTTK